jgi:hypothetical protein
MPGLAPFGGDFPGSRGVYKPGLHKVVDHREYNLRSGGQLVIQRIDISEEPGTEPWEHYRFLVDGEEVAFGSDIKKVFRRSLLSLIGFGDIPEGELDSLGITGCLLTLFDEYQHSIESKRNMEKTVSSRESAPSDKFKN